MTDSFSTRLTLYPSFQNIVLVEKLIKVSTKTILQKLMKYNTSVFVDSSTNILSFKGYSFDKTYREYGEMCHIFKIFEDDECLSISGIDMTKDRIVITFDVDIYTDIGKLFKIICKNEGVESFALTQGDNKLYVLCPFEIINKYIKEVKTSHEHQ